MKTIIATTLVTIATFVTLRPAHAGERFACNMNALSTDERARHAEVTKALSSAVLEQQALKSGYGFRLPSPLLSAAAEWVSREHRCCPFFTFELAQARDAGPLWLRITGPAGVKRFIREELSL